MAPRPPTRQPRYDPPRNHRIETPAVEDEDNALIHTEFRQEKAPDATFRFPQGFDAFKSASDDAKFDDIAKTTGCTLTPEAVGGDTYGVKIYGNKNQCELAKGQLRAWSIARDRAIHTKAVSFPNVRGFNEVKEDSVRSKAAAAERRKKYRADCDTTAFENKRFAHAILLEYKRCDWMDDDKILGVFMEALDPIRMDNKCHITYMSELPIPDQDNEEGFRTGQGFFLCGNKKHLMEQAVERLKNLDKQVIGRKIEAPELFLVKPILLPLDYNAHVIERKPYLRPQLFGRKVNSDIDDKNFQTMHLKDVSGLETDFLSTQKVNVRSIAELDTGAILMGSRHIANLNIEYIDMWLMAMLERLRYWQGYLEMRVSIGTCAFVDFPKAQEYSIYELEEMVESRNSDPDSKGLKACLTTELGDVETEAALLNRFLSAGHSMICKDLVPGRELHPHCIAIFNMKSPWNSAETLRLKAVFKENGYNEYLLDTHQWEILEEGKERARQMVDIKLVDLKHSHTSNGISVVAGSFVTDSQKAKLPGWSLYERFLKKISVISENAKPDVKDRFLFNFEENSSRGGIRLLSLEQRKSYIFEIFTGPGRGYHIELFSFQMPGARKITHFPQNEQRWGVQIWHPSWDTLFYDHQYLEIAMKANWEPAEWQFFPPAANHINDWQDVEGMEFEVGSGYRNMLDAVKVVEKVIRGEAFPLPSAKHKAHGNGTMAGKKDVNGNGSMAGKKDVKGDGKKTGKKDLNGNGTMTGKKNVNGGPDAELMDLNEAEKKQRRPDQTYYQTFSSAVAQGKVTGAAADLAGLKIVHVPVDESKLSGAAKDLAGLFF